jgi:hypothetical protein
MSYRQNKFLAKPHSHAGPTMAGVHSHPGFHTTGTIEVAACYAQAHVVTSLAYEVGERLPDYPVVVTVDMDGMTALADYDAEKTLWPRIMEWLPEFFRMNPTATERDLYHWLEFDPQEGREGPQRGDEASDALFRIASWRIDNPFGAMRDFVESYPGDDLIALLRRLSDGTEKPSQEMLCALADQYRYTEDVDDRRIVSVVYMRPFWPELLSYEDEETDAELAEKLESYGWSVLDVEDVYNEHANVVTREVYKARRKAARPEFHGTSYRNLLSAAPGMGRRMPTPPKPYRGAK